MAMHDITPEISAAIVEDFEEMNGAQMRQDTLPRRVMGIVIGFLTVLFAGLCLAFIAGDGPHKIIGNIAFYWNY